MNPCETSISVAALANAIACNFKSPEEIDAVGAIFVQLGETMATIATQQTLCMSRANKNDKID